MNVSRTVLASLLCSMFLALSPVAYSEAWKNEATNPGNSAAVLAASQDPNDEQAIEMRDLVVRQMSQKDVLRAQELTQELAKPGNFGRALDAYLASRRRN